MRQVFQGKFVADVEFAGEPPHFVSFQAAAFREDSVGEGAAPAKITSVPTTLSADKIRTKPGERFREAKQAVDLSQAEIIVCGRPRHQGSREHRTGQETGGSTGRRNRRFPPHLR